MSLLTITCPRCGYSKNIEQEQIPPSANIQCPKCQHSFTLAPDATASSPPEAAAAPLPPQEEPCEPATTPAPAPATDDAGKSAPAPPTKFCSTCGEKIHRRAEICPKCGVRVAAPRAR